MSKNSNKNGKSLRQWWDDVGTENVIRVTESIGSSLPHMRALRYRIKRPGKAMAAKIIAAAEVITPGFVPDFDVMREPIPPRKPNPNWSPKIQPSKDFLKSRSEEA